MILLTFETQRPFYWTSVTWCFVLLPALCRCNGVLHQKTLEMADPLPSASESSRMPDTIEQPETRSVDLGSLLDARDGAIVTLVAGETRLAAHRAVLAAGSPILASMFHTDTLKGSSSEVNIPGVEGPVLRQLVAYLYTGTVSQLPGMATQLLAAAEIYGVSVLRDSIEQQVAGQLSVENVAATVVLAQRYGSHSLRQAAVAFIRDHLEVLATRGWVEAVLSHPGDALQITRLLAEPPAKTSTTTITYCKPNTFTATNTATATGKDSMSNATATPAATLANTTAAGSMSTPTTSGSTTPTATAQTNSNLGQTAAAPQLPPAGYYCPPVDAATISRFRSLPAEEKGRRMVQAATRGSEQEVRALLAVGADVGASDGYERTALHFAAWHGLVDALQCLLQAGAAVDARDTWLNTPLDRSAESGHTAALRLLLAANADPNASNVAGWAPLHWAAENAEAEAAAALLQAGADRAATTSNGETALDIATRRNRQKLVQMLQ